jgi:hypothetical protein
LFLSNEVKEEVEWAFKLAHHDFEIVGRIVCDDLGRRTGDVDLS